MLLWLITAGLYGIYWLARNGYAVDTRQAPRTAVLASLLLGAFVLLLLTIVVAITGLADAGASGVPPMFPKLFFAAAVATALVYLFAAKLSARIARINRLQGGGAAKSSVAAILTLIAFASAIYLQYHMNKVL